MLELPAPEKFTLENVFFFPAVEGLTAPAAEQITDLSDGFIEISIRPGYVTTYDNETLSGVLSFTDSDGNHRALWVEADVVEPIVSNPNEQGGAASSTSSLLFLFGLAFLGGLILNAMPCVFSNHFY